MMVESLNRNKIRRSEPNVSDKHWVHFLEPRFNKTQGQDVVLQ